MEPLSISLLLFFLVPAILFLLWRYYNAYRLLKREIISLSGKEVDENLPIEAVAEILTNTNKKLKLTSVYLRKLGNLNSGELNPLIINDDIGKSLLYMQDEMNKLKEEENNRNWITEGLAKFGEILRNKMELKDYAAMILSALVKYISGNQGGVFIADKDNEGEFLELIACYAYDKERYLKSKVYEGDGLLGQCLLDHEFIFLTDVPDGYTTITSGLGLSTPSCVVILPLISNEKFLGVIELALFDILKPHQIEFLRKVSINIASEIGSIKTLEHTKKLLSESDQLSQKLKTSEEEMKETIHQLAATQDEMLKQKGELEKKQIELNSYLSAIENTVASVEFDKNKNVIVANTIFLTITGYSMNDLLNCSYLKFMNDDESMKLMWQNILEGKFFSGEFRMKANDGTELWLNGTFNPIFDLQGNTEKVMMCAQFITQEKEKMNELNAMVSSFKASLPVLELSTSLQFKSANEKFLTLFGLTRLSLKSKTLNDILIGDEFSQKIKNQYSTNEDFAILDFVEEFRTKEKVKKYSITISPLKNLQGTVHRYLLMFVQEIE